MSINQTKVVTVEELKKSGLFINPEAYSVTPEYNNGCVVIPPDGVKFTVNANDPYISGSCRSEVAFQRKDNSDQTSKRLIVEASFFVPTSSVPSNHPFSILQIHERPRTIDGITKWLPPAVSLVIKNGKLYLNYSGTEVLEPTTNPYVYSNLLDKDDYIVVGEGFSAVIEVVWAEYDEQCGVLLKPGSVRLNVFGDNYHYENIMIGRAGRKGIFFKTGCYSWEMSRPDIREAGIDVASQSIIVSEVDVETDNDEESANYE